MSLHTWINRLGEVLEATSDNADSVDMERVSALLLVEIARSDHHIDDRERAVIAAALAGASRLSDEEINAIIDEALASADATVSLHEHVRLVNDRFGKPDKIALIEQMWRVARADGDIDKYEEYTVRKLSELLYLKHRDFMQAKLRVLEEPSPLR